MSTIVFASTNANKVQGFAKHFDGTLTPLRALREVEISHSQSNRPERAAHVKAESVLRSPYGIRTNTVVVAESWGLSIPGLGSQSPDRKVKSVIKFNGSEFAKQNSSEQRKRYLAQAEHTLLTLVASITDIEKRRAVLQSSVVVLRSDGQQAIATQTLHGYLTKMPRSNQFAAGLPFSRIFLPCEPDGTPYEKILADLSTPKLNELLPRTPAFVIAAQAAEQFIKEMS